MDPEHTKDDISIRKFVANRGYLPKLREGSIVQCETQYAIRQLMKGYSHFNTLNESGKMLFTDRKYKRGYNRHKIPKYIYGLVKQVATDASCENKYDLDIIEINFFAEHLLKGFGLRCSPTIQMWEYQVELVRNKTDNTGIEIEGVDEMFKYCYVKHQWIKAMCPYCERTGCGYMHIFDDLQAVVLVFDKMSVSECAKRAMVKNWYQNYSNFVRINCVDDMVVERWPVGEGEEFNVAIIDRDE